MTTRLPTLRRTLIIVFSLCVALIIVCLLALSIGSVPVSLSNVLGACTGSSTVPQADQVIILQIRLPRLLLGILVGAGLSVSGLVFQALLRNPLAEPYILGISSGGTVGTLFAIMVLGSSSIFTPAVASFAGSATVMGLVYSIAHRRGKLDMYTLLLAGVMIGAFFNALVLLIIAVVNQELRSAFLWLMGNLSNASAQSVLVVGPPVLLAAGVLFTQAKGFNLVSTGEETALQLGINVATLKKVAYLLASFITGLVVSVSGVVGFVGLIIPHVCRMMFGPDHRLLFPASFLIGALFMVLADLIARTLLSPTEIPVGAVTAAIGAPLFIYLLKRT
ncbi:MAG TPA: iron ABC transporter permease [Bacteroidota bacterium]|nr:iron ABC transporter permease [Bacteroidota bacterium]